MMEQVADQDAIIEFITSVQGLEQDISQKI
jgi:hypothetical protein